MRPPTINCIIVVLVIIHNWRCCLFTLALKHVFTYGFEVLNVRPIRRNTVYLLLKKNKTNKIQFVLFLSDS